MGFYIKTKTKIHGPFSDKQIRGGIKSGKLTSDSLISDSSSGPWSTIAEAFNPNAQAKTSTIQKVKSGKQPASQSPPGLSTSSTAKAELLPDSEAHFLTDAAPPIAATPAPPKAPTNSYWNQQKSSAGLAANSPQSKSGNSNKYDLNRLKNTEVPPNDSLKNTKTLLIVLGSVASVGVLLIITLAFFILLPFMGHQSEIKQARDKAKEMARHMARYNGERSKDEPNKILLSNYEGRVYTLSQEIGEIQDNWSEAEKERFMVWVRSEGVDYAQDFSLSRGRSRLPQSIGTNNRSSSTKGNSSAGKINFSLSNVKLDGIYEFGDPQKGKQAALSTKMSEISASTESGFNTWEWDAKYMEIAFDQGSTKVDLYDVKVSQNGSSLKFSFKIKGIIETVPSVRAQTLELVNKNTSGKTGEISMEIPSSGFPSEANLKSALEKHCQSSQFGALSSD